MRKRSLQDHSEADGDIVVNETTTPRIKRGRPPVARNKAKILQEIHRHNRLGGLDPEITPETAFNTPTRPCHRAAPIFTPSEPKADPLEYTCPLVAAVIQLCLWMI